MSLALKIILIILAVLAVALIVIYFLGRKLQGKQVQAEAAMEAAKMTVSLLVIDKKKMKFSEAGLPKQVYDQAPKYMKFMKVPVVKAKVGPKIMTLMADPSVFEVLPVKQECKVIVSGIYITKILSVRGGTIPKVEKKGLAKLREKLQNKVNSSK